MKIVAVTENNFSIYYNLAQSYEAEFSSITNKRPDESGLFSLDTPVDHKHKAFLPLVDNIPVGLANIGIEKSGYFEVCEFYIMPFIRKKGIGKMFIHNIWSFMPGFWEIKQLESAVYATCFWRSTIKSYHNTQYQESTCDDSYWGKVTRQVFKI